MTRKKSWLRLAAQAWGAGTLLGVWIELSDYRWLGGPALGRTVLLVGVSLAGLMLLALGAKLRRKSRYLPTLGKTGALYLSGMALGLAMSVLLMLLAELTTATVGLMMLKGYGG